jgi:hypothetical protein
VASNIPILLEFVKGRELLSQGHFVVMIMDAVVAEPTYENALVQVIFRIGLLKPGSAMKLFRNEMMKG